MIRWLHRLFCRHEWNRRADLDELFDLGRNKLCGYNCPKCGKRRWRAVW